MPNIRISPTLILGIGSSGLEIINSVRELLYEELGYAGLPLIRFVHISTHTGGEAIKALPNEQFTNDWEKIKILDASIGRDRYNQLKLKIDPRSFMYEPELAEWLNPRIVEIPNQTFDAGAGNFRQAGRLCLWTNWPEIREGIDAVIGQMQHPESREETEVILRQYAHRKNVVLDAGEEIAIMGEQRAFVSGTLVGGTCSGMFLDIGYYLRVNHPQFKTCGNFTTMDSQIAARPASERRAANAYAAAIELDYYTQLGTVFHYRFPHTTSSVNSSESPYHDFYLLSTKNVDGTIAAVVDRAGKPDLHSLHKIIGISTFFDVLGGTSSEKEGIKADYAAITSMYPLVKTQPHFLKCLSTLGATTLWFPKSRISGAAAAKLIKKIISLWLGTDVEENRGKMEPVHNSIVENLKMRLRDRLLQFIDDSGSQITVNAHWSRDTEDIRQRLSSQADRIENIIHYLSASTNMSNNPLASRFKQHGYYFKKIEFNLSLAKNQVFEILRELVENQIREIFSQFEENRQIVTFNDLNYLIDRIYNTIEGFTRVNLNLSDYDLSFSKLQPNFDAIKVEQSRVMTTLVGVRKAVLDQHYKRVFNKLKQILEEETNLLIDYFLVEVFRQILPELKNRLLNIFKNIVTKLNDIMVLATQMETELSIVTSQAALKMISQGESLTEDIEKYFKRVNHSRIKQLVEPLDLHRLLSPEGKSPREVFGAMLRELQREILNDPELSQFDIINTIQTREPATIPTYAQNAQPMMEFAEKYVPQPIDKPTLIAGGKAEPRERLKDQLESKGLGFKREMKLDLDHLLYFYREESVIAISEFKAFAVWKSQYLKISEQDEFGSHIDKDPSQFDIEIHHTLRDIENNRWLKVSQDLFKGEIFSETRDDGRVLIFEYRDEFDNIRRMAFDPQNENIFKEQLAKNKPALEQFRERFEGCFREFGREGVNTRIIEYLKRLEERGLNPSDREYIEQDDFYRKLLDEKCPRENDERKL